MIIEERIPELREKVVEAGLQFEIPGVAVGIYANGTEEYIYHGVTSVPNPLPVDGTTLFQIGSTGKTITATAIMTLVERGEIDLGAPVRNYIPTLRLQDEDVAREVTVLHLLNHTSGWAGDFLVDTGFGDDALERYVALLPEAAQEHPLGERVSYNNSAFMVAGHVIERVTGKPFEAAVRERVFEPLGLTEHFYFPWEIMVRRFAAGHRRGESGLEVTEWERDRCGNPAGTGISATARDQIRYARFHLGHLSGGLRDDTRKGMQEPTTPPSSDGQKGISWHLSEIDGARVVSHGGSTFGHQSALEIVPERDFALVIMTNARHGLELITEIKRWTFEAFLELAEPEPEPLDLIPSQLEAYTGVYEAHTGAISVVVQDDYLVGKLSVNPELGEEIADPEMPFKILPGNQLVIIGGQYRGLKGGIERDDEGNITALNLGRVFTRRE